MADFLRALSGVTFADPVGRSAKEAPETARKDAPQLIKKRLTGPGLVPDLA